jgi:cobalamin biosynthesis protein CobC
MTGLADALAEFRRHGGRLRAAAALFPHAPRPWIDLSTGVNPRPYPSPPVSRATLARLPDPQETAAAEAVAAEAFGAPAENVVAVPGSEAALRLLPRLLGARTVAVAPATYSGHAEAWRAAGAGVTADPDAAEAWVVVNPNNPDGVNAPAGDLLASAEGRWTIVDEAFVDATPELSLARRAGGRLVVLRSFGKFYGLPGLRLGFVVADPSLVARIRLAQGDWPVGAPALAAARAAYADAAWAEAARARLDQDARRLDTVLAAAGLQPLGGTPLFRLVHAPDAPAMFLRLARAGILCRLFEDPHRLRFGLPTGVRAWNRLSAALQGDAP